MGISAGGLISGLDTDALIEATLEVERQPIEQLEEKQADYETQISSYATLKSALSTFQNAITDLKRDYNFINYEASSSDEDVLTASANSFSSEESYEIEVLNIAKAEQMTSKAFTSSDEAIGKGTISIQVGDENAIEIEIDGTDDNNTLAGMASAINSSGANVKASVIKAGDETFYLSIKGTETGQDVKINFQEESDFTTSLAMTTQRSASSSYGEQIVSEEFDDNNTALGKSGTITINDVAIDVDGTETLDELSKTIDKAMKDALKEAEEQLKEEEKKDEDSQDKDLINRLNETISQLNVSSEVIKTDEGTYKLQLTNNDAQGTINFTLQDTDQDTGLSSLSLTTTQEAELARLKFNGLEIERADNTIDDITKGLEITLKSTSQEGETVIVKINSDYSDIEEKLEKFVESYNDLIDTFVELQSYDFDTKEAGVLIGDSTTSRVRNSLSSIIHSSVSGVDSAVNTLSKLGIELGTQTTDDEGNVIDNYLKKLNFDKDTFNDAIENYPDDVISFFTSDDDDNLGIALQFDEVLSSYLDTNGLIASKEDSIESSIDRITKQIEAKETAIAKREEQLRDQYSYLEELLAELQSTSSYLEQLYSSSD